MAVYRIVTRTVTLTLLSLAAAAPLLAAEAAGNVRLTGCLVRGDDGGYLLTYVPSAPSGRRADPSITPGAVGTSGTLAPVFYWLRDDDSLRGYVGQRVEIQGDAREISDGKLEIDNKASWSEIEVRADGESLKAKVPLWSVMPAGDGDGSFPIWVRKVVVDAISVVSSTCR